MARLRNKYQQFLRDLGNAVAWHCAGGKLIFSEYYEELRYSHRWCFLIGCNNSGTSLLQSIIGNTGEVSTMFLEGQRNTRAIPRANNKRFRGVWTEDLTNLKVDPGRAEEQGPRLVHDWTRSVTRPRHQLLLEKTTVNSVRMPFLERVFPDSRFIGLVRSGYAVSEGIHRKAGASLERSARHWNCVNRIMRDDSQLVENYLEIKYEDLTLAPQLIGARLAGFLGVKESRVLRSLEQTYSRPSIDGTEPRRIKNMNPLSLARLTADDKAVIGREASEMLAYFGYDEEG